MYRVMLVDDEPIVIRGMKQLIDWEEAGYEIAGWAYSAEEALDKLDEVKPHIIITDLVMPEIDGIEFIRRVKAKHPDMETIILSGYGEFEYAQKALSSGVCAYLVKPVTRSQLIATLQKATQAIKKRLDYQVEYKRLKKRLKESMPLLKNRYILDIIKGRIQDSEEIERRCTLIDFHLKGISMIAVMDASGHLMMDSEENADVYFNFAIKSTCEAYLERYGRSYVTFDEQYLCIIVTGLDETFDEHTAYELLSGLWYDIESKYEVKATIGMGTCIADLDEAPMVYRAALNALKSQFFLGEGQIIHYKHAAIENKTMTVYPDDAVNEVIERIRYGSNCDPEKLAKVLIKHFVKAAGCDIETIYTYCYQFCIQLTRVLKSYQKGQPLTSGQDFLATAGEQIKANKTMTELHKWLTHLIHEEIKAIATLRSDKLNSVVDKVVKHIHADLGGDLTLNTIANIVFMNPAYFSTLFKSTTGSMYHEYVFNERMKKAQELLLDSQLKVYEVAEQVGYSNARSFSDAFKRFSGLSPSGYVDAHLDK